MDHEKSAVSRREFLKMAGIAGATVSLGAGLGGLVIACGEEEAATTTAAPATAAGPATTAAPVTTASSSTTVTTAAEVGREIKVGFAAPITGGLAVWGDAAKYCVERATEALEDGLVSGDGLKHPVNIILRDNQSDSNRAASVAADFINNDKVDIILPVATADGVNPVADQSESYGVPCISTTAPWQNFIFGRGGTPATVYKWTYNVWWGVEDVMACMLGAVSQLPTNKKAAVMLGNDALGNAWMKPVQAALEAAGYKADMVGQYQPGTEDFTAPISAFKKSGDELVVGSMWPADFAVFWSQALQQSFKPKTAFISLALNFPEEAEALGDRCINLATSCVWHPKFPFKSELLGGETCQQFADEYEKRRGSQWTQALDLFLLFDWAFDALKRTQNLDDRASVIEAVKTTKVETLGGMIDFTAPVDPAGMAKPGPSRNLENNYKTPLLGVQWRKGTKWPYEQVVVDVSAAPMVEVEGPMQGLS